MSVTSAQLIAAKTASQFTTGSAGAPSIAFSGDTSTGIYSPGTGQLALATAGSGRLFIDSSGNVNLGSTTSASSTSPIKLSLGGQYTPDASIAYGTLKFKIWDDGTVGAGMTMLASGPAYVAQQGGHHLFFTSASGAPTERLRITSAGFVGIGNSSPGAILDVSPDANRNLQVQGKSGTTYGLELKNGTANIGGEFHITAASSASVVFNRGSTEIARFTSTGLGIGTTSPVSTLDCTGQLAISNNASSYWLFDRDDSNGRLKLLDSSTTTNERLAVDTSGRLLVGTSSARSNVNGDTPQLQIEGTNYATSELSLTCNNNSAAVAPAFYLSHSRGTTIGSNTILQNGDDAGFIVFNGSDGTNFLPLAWIRGQVDGTPGTNNMPGRLIFSTTASGASSPTERMRITNLGETQFKSNGLANYAQRLFSNNGAQDLIFIEEYGSGSPTATAAIFRLTKHATNNRSINATGTINASGADYAEYMTKSGNFDIAKGDLCGINSDGLLTLNYADSVSYVVKSTNPSYVGGDTWSQETRPNDENGDEYGADTEEYKEWFTKHEFARSKVDRIAFAGQVPVNVLSATPGQYIVPIDAGDGSITGIAKDEADLTLAEYMRAVGKVIAIEDDGRARIIVKVA